MKESKHYEIDIAIINRTTDECENISEQCNTREEAEDRKREILDAMPEDCYPTWKKVYPVVKCCGQDVPCMNFTNTCDTCGTDYNFNGDQLAPRSHWGEETGESWEECY